MALQQRLMGPQPFLLGGCLLVGTDFEHPGLSVSAANTKMVQVFVKSVRGPTLTLDMAPNATVCPKTIPLHSSVHGMLACPCAARFILAVMQFS